ncbi:hypothetical protein BSL78_02582 [Apostichopus japonicus]|uniref:Uncharacterized protein n=1 Tax=Stichopus japonicus TaxID=307972 RepID=A0A2G8LJP1_STIJA|nr:hypothetical protein BSL78_02582 [Apostichopus japonicus]
MEGLSDNQAILCSYSNLKLTLSLLFSQSRPVSLASQELDRPLSVEVEATPPPSQYVPPVSQPPMTEPPPEPNQMMKMDPMNQAPRWGSKFRPQMQRHSSESGDEKQVPKVRCLYNHIAAGETQLNFQEPNMHNPQLQQQQQQQQQQQTTSGPSEHARRKAMSVSSENLARTNGDNYPSPDYSVNDSPGHMKFFSGTPPPPSQTHGGLLITTSQQSLPSTIDSSSGSQLSSGSLTQQNSSGMNEAALEKPSTPTHSPPPPPSEGGAKQPFDAGDTG